MSRLIGNVLAAYAIYKAWKQRSPRPRRIAVGPITSHTLAASTITATNIAAVTITSTTIRGGG